MAYQVINQTLMLGSQVWYKKLKQQTFENNSDGFSTNLDPFTGVFGFPVEKIMKPETKLTVVMCCHLFKASALWANAFYKSKCPSVCTSVRLCVCSLLRYRLTVFLTPLPEVGCPIFLDIRNPWGKVMERSGLRYEHFCLKIV